MILQMVGIDSAISLEEREKFAFTSEGLVQAYSRIRGLKKVSGAVLISTCNRTELYLSTSNETEIDLEAFICYLAGIERDQVGNIFVIKKGLKVFSHLCEVASGVRSQIWGEDQILTQVKNALSRAREEKMADNYLEVLFRNGIAAAKKVKTNVKLTDRETSIVHRAEEILRQYGQIKKILVIGNGEIGTLVAKRLMARNYEVTMTLRRYRYHENKIPSGVKVIPYEERYDFFEHFDGVVSATLSPHHTIELNQLKKIPKIPEVYIDLALPRDIEPEISNLAGVKIYDIDSISSKQIQENRMNQLGKVDLIIEKYKEDYQRWCLYRKGLNLL